MNARTMNEMIRKEIMCYQQSKAKGEQGNNWQPRKGHKGGSNFKSLRTSNFKNSAGNFLSKKLGRNHQRNHWPAEEKRTEASSKPEHGQSQKPPLQCCGCGEAHYFKNCPQRGRNDTLENLQEASIVGDVARNIPRINAALEDRREYYQPMIIELEGKLIL